MHRAAESRRIPCVPARRRVSEASQDPAQGSHQDRELSNAMPAYCPKAVDGRGRSMGEVGRLPVEQIAMLMG
jgi:hypothetical protein